MIRRDPSAARVLGLWTAGWLGGLLLAGLLWIGDLSVQWPVLLVPLSWALLALRPRRSSSSSRPAPPPVRADRSDTVERPAVRPPDARRYRDG
jgi:hypothetical protein